MTVLEHRKHGDAGDGAASGALGARVTRIDGPAKVTGAADYALEHRPEDLVYLAFATSPVPAGPLDIDAAEAEAAPGVIAVLTAANLPPLRAAAGWRGGPQPEGEWRAFSDQARWAGEPVAAVAAESWDQALEAVSRLKVTARGGPVPFVADLDDPRAPEGEEVPDTAIVWGQAEAEYEDAPVKIDATYRTPREHHVTIEPHGLIARWEGDALTLWEPSQWLAGMARSYAEHFDVPAEDVRIVSPYIGGGFGSKAMVYAYGAVAAQAARILGRPVKAPLTRAQTFTAFGGRAATRNRMRLGADREGRLRALIQDSANEVSVAGPWPESPAKATAEMYAVPAFRSRHLLVAANTVIPGALRAPGETPGAFGLECAMDELAHELGLDPLEVRLRNYAEVDPHSGLPWSTRPLREAYEAGAARFGWHRRPIAPRMMREGHELVGWGMGAGAFPVLRNPAEARLIVHPDGGVEVLSAGIDMGQGTYTVLAQAAAETLGVDPAKVSVRLGDSRLPASPIAGGSQLANNLTAAVAKAAEAARDELVARALSHEGSPFRDAQANTLVLEGGRIRLPRDGGEGVALADLLAATGGEGVDVTRGTHPEGADAEERQLSASTMARTAMGGGDAFKINAWAVHFAEVRVDEALGRVRVSRMVSAIDSGRLYNPRLAESQWKGAMVMGIGMALLEGGVVDRRFGRAINADLGDYLAPTQADVPEIEVIDMGRPDPNASPLGGKSVGEIGIVGVAPAIANAVFHATGKRIRDLPITIDKILGA